MSEPNSVFVVVVFGFCFLWFFFFFEFLMLVYIERIQTQMWGLAKRTKSLLHFLSGPNPGTKRSDTESRKRSSCAFSLQDAISWAPSFVLCRTQSSSWKDSWKSSCFPVLDIMRTFPSVKLNELQNKRVTNFIFTRKVTKLRKKENIPWPALHMLGCCLAWAERPPKCSHAIGRNTPFTAQHLWKVGDSVFWGKPLHAPCSLLCSVLLPVCVLLRNWVSISTNLPAFAEYYGVRALLHPLAGEYWKIFLGSRLFYHPYMKNNVELCFF